MNKKYLSEDEIVNIMISELSEKDFNYIKTLKKENDMIQFHHSVGRYIRNRFLLWDKNNPYTKISNCQEKNGIIIDPLFPDQVSHRILVNIWKKVNEL